MYVSYCPKVLPLCQVLLNISPTCNIVTEQIPETRVYFPYLAKHIVYHHAFSMKMGVEI